MGLFFGIKNGLVGGKGGLAIAGMKLESGGKDDEVRLGLEGGMVVAPRKVCGFKIFDLAGLEIKDLDGV